MNSHILFRLAHALLHRRGVTGPLWGALSGGNSRGKDTMHRKVVLHGTFALFLLTCFTVFAQTGTAIPKKASTATSITQQAKISPQGQTCLDCHTSSTPVL